MKLAGLVLAGAIVAALIPSRFLQRTPTLCPFRRLTGRPCPACGLTRSWNAAARLEFGRSFANHPLGPLAVPAIVWLISRHSAPGRIGEQRQQLALWIFGGTWLGAWLLRLVRAGERTDRGGQDVG